MNKKIGLVGCGRWGSIWARVLFERGVLSWVCDTDLESLKFFQEKNPYLNHYYNDPADVNFSDTDGVVIATPPETHFRVAKGFLEQETPVLLEKPLTLKPENTVELNRIAEENETPLLCGHTFLHSRAVQTAIYLFANTREIPTEIDFTWGQEGSNSPLSPVWNLGPHPVSILYAIHSAVYPHSETPAYQIHERRGYTYILNSSKYETTVNLCLSHCWGGKERNFYIEGETCSVSCDPKENRVLFYDGENETELDIRVTAPEPLGEELDLFLERIDNRHQYRYSSKNGEWTVAMLNALENFENE